MEEILMEEIFKIKNIYYNYNGTPVLSKVYFSVTKGEFFGIIGPNGAGKSTLLKIMSGALPVQEGDVLCSGVSLFSLKPKEIARKIAFVPAEPNFPFPFTVHDFVLMGRYPYISRWQEENESDHRIVQRSLELTGISYLAFRSITELSSGEKQRVLVARALAQQPQVLLLDEPTTHLDITGQIAVLDLLKRLNRELGLTVVMVLHDLNLASEYCQRLLLVRQGEVYKVGLPEEVLTYPIIEEVYKTVVVVEKNPLSSKPYVLVVTEEEKEKGKNQYLWKKEKG